MLLVNFDLLFLDHGKSDHPIHYNLQAYFVSICQVNGKSITLMLMSLLDTFFFYQGPQPHVFHVASCHRYVIMHVEVTNFTFDLNNC